MPELPEVETTRRGIEPYLVGHTIRHLHVRQPRLRWPVPDEVHRVVNQPIEQISRRGKYLLMQTPPGYLIWHLGMSGSMRILPRDAAVELHEHICIELDDGNSLRFRDPRRFGALLFSDTDPLLHERLVRLGPEPLSEAFNGDYLLQQCRERRSPIKTAIMDSHVVVGVGNIYACESLYLSRINPKIPAGRISRQRLERLVVAIKDVLTQAIAAGGTTLQDFTRADGKPGYFRHSLQVYGREGEPCLTCQRPLKRVSIGQRSTFYCTHCQH